MNYKDSLLYISLIQVSHVSVKREENYWKKGIVSIEDLISSSQRQLSLFPSALECEVAYLMNDAGHNVDKIASIFEKKSGKKDFYRIAYSVPEYILFLDIETTGLSPVYHYITMVGWMMNGKYGCWIAGTDPTELKEVCHKAKMIVTFNGTRFDVKFLNNAFPDLNIADKPNLDLMHFCKRFGFVRGQKNIENELKFNRPKDIQDCNGKEAIALWYKFIFGEDSALDLLIEYNFYDISGMTYILDKIFFKYIWGKKIPKYGKLKRFYNSRRRFHIFYSKKKRNDIRKSINAKNFNLDVLVYSKSKRIIGIDLAGVIKKSSNTGICLLTDKYATTSAVKYDDEIVKYIVDSKADIVSIDAPLSLPVGRTSVYNDDPMREEAGIKRWCERELDLRGIRSYPALIDTMQTLTKRGINLSMRLRKMGYPVIECFPGAAQDILQLPRKRTDVELLKTGLLRLGIHGDFEERKVVHDELDAITAAVVGKFFIDGYFEPIGIPEENDMIVPSIDRNSNDNNLIIGITGTIAAGKTTVSTYIAEKGFAYTRYSLIIAEMLKEKGIPVNRFSLQKAGGDLFESQKQYDLNKKVENYIAGNSNVVIDGIRHYEDYTYWKEKNFKNFYLVYIQTDPEICAIRYKEKEFQKVINHNVEQEVTSLRQFADVVINNNGTFDDLYLQIDNLISEVFSKE